MKREDYKLHSKLHALHVVPQTQVGLRHMFHQVDVNDIKHINISSMDQVFTFL